MMHMPEELIKEENRAAFRQQREDLLAKATKDDIENPKKFQRVADVADEIEYPFFTNVTSYFRNGRIPLHWV